MAKGEGQPAALTLLILLAMLISTAEAKPPTTKNKEDLKSCGGAKKCLGVSKLDRILKKCGMSHKSVDQLAQQLDEDGDLGVDTLSDTLVYECAGVLPAPPAAAAVSTAAVADPAVAATTAGMLAGPTAAILSTEPTPADAPRHHHHHHHHRHLSQTTATAVTAAGLAVAQGEIASGWMPDTPDAPAGGLSVAQVFTLHSRPSAVKKILLDFNGHQTVNTQWNAAKGLSVINTPPFDTDGNSSNWSAGELADVFAMWRSVAEDFAPWDVDVTTEDPGEAYLSGNGVRAAIGGSYSDWYGTACGGVAYVGLFGNSYYSPAFIFAVSLSNSAKYIWEAVSHEVGHTLGLSHDGVSGGAAYYTGTANKLWAPIMGAGYYCAVTQFSKGEYAGANNLEDDYAVVSNRLGVVTSWPDEQGSTIATATPFNTTYNADLTATGWGYGIIRSPADIDVYSFTATAPGTVSISVLVAPGYGGDPSWARSDLAAVVTLYNAAGTPLTTAAGVGLVTQVAVPAAGQYFVAIAGSGLNDPLSTGFSSYASRGQYKLSAVFPASLPLTPSPSPQPPSPSPQPPSPSPQPPSPSPSPQPPSPSPSPQPPSPSPQPPSPSPSPQPPSPSPQPPSPSPQPPSPSPQLPSPSPPPLQPAYMTISSITNTRSTQGNKAYCNAKVTVVSSADGSLLDNAVVTATWGAVPSRSGWPYTVTPTTVTGVAGSKSTNLSNGKGNGCTFTVTDVALPGHILDPNAPMVGPPLNW